MFSVSKTTGYAIRAMCCLDLSRDQLVRARQIADCTDMPKPYLSKVLHALGRSGLITTKRGRRGGFALARPPAQITLLDIVEAVEGTDWLEHCLLGMTECREERSCPTREFWKIERKRIRAELARLTLAMISEFKVAAGEARECRPMPRPAARRVQRARSSSRMGRLHLSKRSQPRKRMKEQRR